MEQSIARSRESAIALSLDQSPAASPSKGVTSTNIDAYLSCGMTRLRKSISLLTYFASWDLHFYVDLSL
jgi:hypothetical protein